MSKTEKKTPKSPAEALARAFVLKKVEKKPRP